MPRELPKLKIKRLHPNARLPKRATPGSTGLDLCACIENEGKIALSAQPRLIPTGIAIEVPRGYDVQIRPRSGLSAKGVGVTFGTIDSDYRGEILVTMYLFDPDATFEIKHGDRIAQMVISRIADLPIVEVEELSATERGSGGHGSTGK
ncbi:MAG: dUTP diphosphatase [Chloroflexi bacterium]|nr:dUTP diphosphatase [Chloroflexota bacterium]